VGGFGVGATGASVSPRLPSKLRGFWFFPRWVCLPPSVLAFWSYKLTEPGQLRSFAAILDVRPTVGQTAALDAGHSTAVMLFVAIAHSRLTAQGQISVPAAVRRKLGVGPGSTLEWHEEGERVVVRRFGRFTSADMHEAVFSSPPKPRTLVELKAGLKTYVKRRHARR